MRDPQLPRWSELTDEQAGRWREILTRITGMLPPDGVSVLVDGTAHVDGGARQAVVVADRLADTLRTAGRPCVRLTDGGAPPPGTVVIADGQAHVPADGWDVVIWLRTRGGQRGPTTPDEDGRGAAIVVDLHDPSWPVIRRVSTRLADAGRWYVAESRAFFAVRAATWDTKFGDDMPSYEAAVADAGLPAGGLVVDVGCGTGRALPALRAAIGASGIVIGLDVTPQMLAVARAGGRTEGVGLVLADVRHLPMADGSVDALFAAGLVMHLPDVDAGLSELARVTRPGGRLVLFHPSGRAALAARHGRTLRADEPLAERPLRGAAGRTGWLLTAYDDAAHRFFAVAVRR